MCVVMWSFIPSVLSVHGCFAYYMFCRTDIVQKCDTCDIKYKIKANYIFVLLLLNTLTLVMLAPSIRFGWRHGDCRCHITFPHHGICSYIITRNFKAIFLQKFIESRVEKVSCLPLKNNAAWQGKFVTKSSEPLELQHNYALGHLLITVGIHLLLG